MCTSGTNKTRITNFPKPFSTHIMTRCLVECNYLNLGLHGLLITQYLHEADCYINYSACHRTTHEKGKETFHSLNPFRQIPTYKILCTFKQESARKIKDRKRQQSSTFITCVIFYISSVSAENRYPSLGHVLYLYRHKTFYIYHF